MRVIKAVSRRDFERFLCASHVGNRRQCMAAFPKEFGCILDALRDVGQAQKGMARWSSISV